MKRTASIFFVAVICILLVLSASSARQAILSSAAPNDVPPVYLPLVWNGSLSPQSRLFVVDHTDTDVSVIPDYWIEQAKKFVVHYAHTSHGSQVLSGLEWLESSDPKYNVDIAGQRIGRFTRRYHRTAHLRWQQLPWRHSYITPEMYWESEDGINTHPQRGGHRLVRFLVMDLVRTGFFLYPSQIQNYLDVMAQLETEYPGMRFIYYTGHTDGTAPGSTLWQNNDMIRQYVQDNQKVLFDFNDMEVYAPDGSGPYYNDGDGYCEWCDAWCSAHPTAFECQDVPRAATTPTDCSAPSKARPSGC